jgi:hypothetical protein
MIILKIVFKIAYMRLCIHSRNPTTHEAVNEV